MADDRNRRFAAPLIGALAALGARYAVVTPGSRNTPISLALATEESVHDISMHDERSAAFVALGIARATGVPTLLTCTSGTAAAEYLPAIIEASHSRVPLVIVTADRPGDLTDVGAPQAIDQTGLFGAAVRWSHDMEVPVPGDVPAAYPGALAGRLWIEAMTPPRGPVHLNLRMREPLMPSGKPPGPGAVPDVEIGSIAPGDSALRRLTRLISGRRTVVVCGPQDDPAFPSAAAALAAALDVPVIADPLSGLRSGPFDRRRVLDTGDLLGAARWIDATSPDVVIRTGAIPTSKALWSWMAAHPEVPQVLIDDAGWRDPLASASLVVRADPSRTLAALAEQALDPAPVEWADTWKAAGDAARAAAAEVVGSHEFPTEPGIVGVVAEALSDGATLWAASSMPIRDVDAFFPGTDRGIRILANRGANGIDGLLSSGFGHALASGRPTLILSGDLSALHDLTALAAAARLGVPATVLVVNNDGGGIFEMLSQAGLDRPTFERHFGTPHGLRFAPVAESLGIEAQEIGDRNELVAAVSSVGAGPRLVEVNTDRRTNADLHREIRAAVRDALAVTSGDRLNGR